MAEYAVRLGPLSRLARGPEGDTPKVGRGISSQKTAIIYRTQPDLYKTLKEKIYAMLR